MYRHKSKKHNICPPNAIGKYTVCKNPPKGTKLRIKASFPSSLTHPQSLSEEKKSWDLSAATVLGTSSDMGKRYDTHADRNPWRQSQPRCSNVQDTGRKFNLMRTPYPSFHKPWGNHSPDFKGVYHTYFQSIWKTILSTNRPRRVTRLRGLPGTPTTHKEEVKATSTARDLGGSQPVLPGFCQGAWTHWFHKLFCPLE